MSTGLEHRPHHQPKQLDVVSRHSPLSPYYSPDGSPVTSGDYEQRIKDKLKAAERQIPPWIRWLARRGPPPSRTRTILTTSTTIVVTSVLLVYFANAVVVYDKETRIDQLLKERLLLRHQRDELIALSHSAPHHH
ncbi:hypothetical protein BASA50_001639 [Batrachochytrium salamandrivorans]|uniref:Transmembrane protein n=1 Tax=Batrachochytrium salamandrivorans TaxID=1357716 RepID=A0ABQ8FNH1_9FUNG|nr:hypothetical protein BASA62_008901 [Batrachochytrium salamandrivorans]KAH6578712.1 hypothetical protein BASA60_003548 [Batrachochytrium salamandrivorans]KAH6579555.1 hypothetical protein BASA61_010188 [Batrachochytrium salamandrivorans]KAH6601368.1 hypothetical protein BASA50_001639 [Batrachochytrium salamandrivorans]KAH9250526.1 hypothetical protein BASA81_011703 [Batrachochytrium salamandrivorans]